VLIKLPANILKLNGICTVCYSLFQTSSEPFVQTEASMAVVVDEYDPMRPNDYEECKQKQREKEQHEKELEKSQRDKDYDDRLESVHNRNVYIDQTYYSKAC
jgi:hypothetical protein